MDEIERRDALVPVEMMMAPMQPMQAMQSPLRNGSRSARLDGPMQPMQPPPRQLAGPGVSQTFDMASRSQQAPNNGWGQRQPGASQVFDGYGYNSDGYGMGMGMGMGGGYANELGPNPWANMPQGPASGQGWGNQ
jgi:hypothetical protein